MMGTWDIKNLVAVRGGGDIATGTILKLYRSGFPVLILETEKPSAIRRKVAFCEAIYDGRCTVETITCKRADSLENALQIIREQGLAILSDPQADSLSVVKPIALVDGILAKRNLGTHRKMAPITIGIGPGFTAGVDVDAVIETLRGHHLGRVIYEGTAEANTGIPGEIAGVSTERVVRSPKAGYLKSVCAIGDTVQKGELIAVIETDEENVPVSATITGVIRGMIRDGYPVTEGFKIADIDPRIGETVNCSTVSDKARCIAGGVLEAIMHMKWVKGL